MMDEIGFRKYLKKSGKKDHVVSELVNQVKAFEAYLRNKGQSGVDIAGEVDIKDYIDSLQPGRINVHIRGIALYYRFLGNANLARMVSDFREHEIKKFRHIFKLSEFRGVDQAAIVKLAYQGIVNVNQMQEAGKTSASRQRLSDTTGIPLPAILELVKLSDLSRLGAVKSVRARLYYDAGLDTPEKFTKWEPKALRQYLVDWVHRTGFNGIAPLPKEIATAISTARELPDAIEY
jgi:hypothetical protein